MQLDLYLKFVCLIIILLYYSIRFINPLLINFFFQFIKFHFNDLYLF